MGEYIANKVRCKNCKHYKPLNGQKHVGVCKQNSVCGTTILTRPNKQIEFCFEENKGGKNETDI